MQTTDAARRSRRALVPLAVAGVAVLATLGVLDLATSTEPGPDAIRVPPTVTGPELIACSRSIVVGDVRIVDDTGPHDTTTGVTLEVREWLKPASATRREVEVTVPSPRYSGESRPQPGERVLAVTWTYPYESATRLFRDTGKPGGLDDVRAQLARDLPRAARTKCPGFWSDPEGYNADSDDDE